MNWLSWLNYSEPFDSEYYDFDKDVKLSCFVKGLIRLMKEKPEKWISKKRIGVGTLYYWWTSNSEKKIDSGITLSPEGEINVLNLFFETSRYEREALLRARTKFIIKAVEHEGETERNKVIREIESYGCEQKKN